MVGAPQDALFGIVLVANAVIGIGQKLRAKITLDRLAVLRAPRVRVNRDGVAQHIAVADLVIDDLVRLRPGDQLVADGVVTTSASLQADESLLTGESDPVDKLAGDRLLSGSFVPTRAAARRAASGPKRTPASWPPPAQGPASLPTCLPPGRPAGGPGQPGTGSP